MYKTFTFLLFLSQLLLIKMLTKSLQVLHNNNRSFVSKCHQSVCLNGICWPINSSNLQEEQCYCRNGFTGSYCQVNYDDCKDFECLNHGICVDGIADAWCLCPPGFVGKKCETEINECLSNPCKSGGTCVDGKNSYKCICPPKYTGSNCEIDLSTCKSSPLKCLHGYCVDHPQSHCICEAGFEGEHCQKEIDECLSIPCKNQAKCVDLIADYQCICPHNKTGKNCDYDVNECTSNDCKHDSLCLEINENNNKQRKHICFCLPGFYGLNCEHHYSKCLANNWCENGGLCISGESNYHCQCKENFYGKHCEIDCQKNSNLCPPISSNMSTSEPSLLSLSSSSVLIIDIQPTIATPQLISSTINEQNSTPKFNSSQSEENGLFSTINYHSQSSTVYQLVSSLLSNHYLESSSKRFENNETTNKINNLYDFFMPKFDGVNSYFTLVNDKVRISSSTNLLFKFKSITNDGVIVSTIDESSSNRKFFMIIYILNGHLKVAFSCNGWEMLLIEHPNQIKSNTWYEVAFNLLFRRNNCEARLLLDKSLEIRAEQGINITNNEWPCFNEFYFAKLANNWLQSFQLIAKQNFNGCLQDIHVDGLTRIVDHDNVQECDHQKLLSCSLPVCGVNGDCSSDGKSWSCNCYPGYYGRQCQRANCDPNPCLNGAICIQINRSQLTCMCNKGWFGNYCQLDFIETIPAFGYLTHKPNSYIVYPINLERSSQIEFRLRFLVENNHRNNSLLFFLGNDGEFRLSTKRQDFMSLSIKNELLILHINLGLGVRKLSTKMNDKPIHSVYVGQHKQFVWMVTDGLSRDLAIVPTIVDHQPTNGESFLYVGNFKDSQSNGFLPFKGCIFDLEYRKSFNSTFAPFSDLLASSNIINCQDVHRCSRKRN